MAYGLFRKVFPIGISTHHTCPKVCTGLYRVFQVILLALGELTCLALKGSRLTWVITIIDKGIEILILIEVNTTVTLHLYSIFGISCRVVSACIKGWCISKHIGVILCSQYQYIGSGGVHSRGSTIVPSFRFVILGTTPRE